MKESPAMLWNCDVSDRKEVERMVSLYDDDGTRTVEPGMKAETGELLVRRCCNELGFAIDELIAMDLVDETGVYENPAAAIGTMFAEAALEHARADAEYFDEDFRMRATEGIDMWTAAREIAKSVPEAKPAEEEPAQTHGPKH